MQCYLIIVHNCLLKLTFYHSSTTFNLQVTLLICQFNIYLLFHTHEFLLMQFFFFHRASARTGASGRATCTTPCGYSAPHATSGAACTAAPPTTTTMATTVTVTTTQTARRAPPSFTATIPRSALQSFQCRLFRIFYD